MYICETYISVAINHFWLPIVSRWWRRMENTPRRQKHRFSDPSHRARAALHPSSRMHLQTFTKLCILYIQCYRVSFERIGISVNTRHCARSGAAVLIQIIYRQCNLASKTRQECCCGRRCRYAALMVVVWGWWFGGGIAVMLLRVFH